MSLLDAVQPSYRLLKLTQIQHIILSVTADPSSTDFGHSDELTQGS